MAWGATRILAGKEITLSDWVNLNRKRPVVVCHRALVLEETSLLEGEELGIGDDEMVQDLDAEDFAGLCQALGKLDVVLTRGRVA